LPPQERFKLSALGGDSSPASNKIASNDADANIPASVRNNNPGAMYPGKIASLFGATGEENLSTGHKIARFENPIQGAAAQFALLNSFYKDMTLKDALNKWSGGNNVDSYVSFVQQRTGLSPNTPITTELLQSPVGVALTKAMSAFETGREFPLADQEWFAAQKL